jgi:plastocyanin
MKRTLLVVAIVGAALVAVPAQAGPRKSVGVYDNYYLPAKATLKPNTTVTWRWPADGGGDVHDVKLKKAPAGAKKFQSDPGSAGYTYRYTLKKPGKYSFVCTFHEEMTMALTVKK